MSQATMNDALPTAAAASGLKMDSAIYRRRRLTNKLTMTISMLTMVFGLFWLFWILITLLQHGLSGINWQVFTESTPPPGSTGGLANAIYGSLVMTAFGTLFGTPIGILAGIYLAEFGQRGWLAPATRFINDILLSAPSIVIGLFVYEVYVVSVGHFSGWAGSCALAILVIPVVVRTTENMLRLVPNSLREAAAALGAPQWKVTMQVTLRSAKAGVMTGILLAVARISGETAPLLFTALNNQFFNSNMNQPMANLPIVIFQFAMSPYEDWHALAWAGSLLITFSVLTLNIVARWMGGRKNQSN
ncbi:phosphate ABC transporter permease PstA [Chromobacterium sp. ASV23]|uniref:phosphate ABC transporter permease PstA n=1 Tax=Chromobacterium sp. ASV23 TaxID=2795110 RepID=UPI0034CF95DC